MKLSHHQATNRTIRNITASIIFILSISHAAQLAASQSLPNRISFQHLLKNKDIVLGEVSAIFQDNAGFLWFGGATALIRYDGYEFRQIDISQIKNGATELVPVNPVADIQQDRSGILWVSTRNGMLYYDPETEKLQRIPDDPQQETLISSMDILESLELPSGEIIAASNDGLLVIDPQSKKYQVITANPKNPNGLHSTRVRSLHLSMNGSLWVGTNAGLERVNWKTKHFTVLKPYPKDPTLISENSVADIVQDQEGNFWLGTSNGLVHLDPKSGEIQRYVHTPANPRSLSGNDIWSLLLDKNGTLWIASDGGGISILDYAPDGTPIFNNQLFDPGRESSLSSNQVRVVAEDNNSDIWVGNYPSGINFFDRSSAGFNTYTQDPSDPKSLSHNSILSMKEDPKGNLWLGTDGGGLNYFDRNTEMFRAFKHSPSDDSTISSNAILTTYLDEQGNVWAGTWGGGISIYSPDTNTFTRLPFDEQRSMSADGKTSKRLNNAHVWSIKEDSNKDLWIATHAGGLSKYDRASNTYTHYWHDPDDNTSITSAIVWDTFEDSNHNFWVATSTGLNRMSRSNGTFERFISNSDDPNSLSNPSVLSLHEDSRGRLWFGTDAGLNMLNPDGITFTVYDQSNGFNDSTIRQILEDRQGKFWLSTNNGVTLFDPMTKEVKNYNRESGRLVGSFHTDSGLISQKGEIVFGGVNGLRFYSPHKLIDNSTVPPIVLTDFKIFADSVLVGAKDGLLSKSVNRTDTITLDYKKSMFVFGFSALNYRDNGKNQYAYKLEGFDQEWLQVGKQRTAKYTNLNAGKYVFHVRGSNNDGVWNEQGKKITILQLPPPWLTWWAYSIYLLLILSLIFWFIHHQKQKRKVIEEQNRLLEAQVAERTGELRQKNNDINAMLENMPQGLFTVQHNGVIHPEYSLYLEEIFETKNIANRSVCDLLFSQAEVGADTLDAFKAALSAIILEDEMCFGFNSPLLISEFHITVKNTIKYLSLDWNPIIIDGTVSKLMVSVRDVTQLKDMEEAAAEQKRELDIISQLLNLSSEKVLAFEESSTRYINENRMVIEENTSLNQDAVALLYRNMHTIKGNCRTYGFCHLSDIVHEIESTYTSLRSHPESPWDPEHLLGDLDQVEKGLAEYSDVYRRVLGRGEEDASSRGDGFWMDKAVMDKIQEHAEHKQFEALHGYIDNIQSKPIENILVDIIASLSSIAKQLGKPTPLVSIDAHSVRIRNTGIELLTDVFAHILRNCVDHGIEPIEERVATGKTQQGNIIITALLVENKLNIYVNDDGRGINISRLFAKGVELGIWLEHNKPSNQEIAELIFCSGVSTKEVISDISGRGVGLDAVKQFLTKRGGSVEILLQSAKSEDEDHVPFELLIQFPNNEFIITNTDNS